MFLWIAEKCFSQDAFYGVSNGAFLYENPANTGASGDLRINNIYKNQHGTLQGNYNTNFLSVDFMKNGTGLGVYFIADQAGTASVRKLEFAAIYSYLTQLSDKIGLSFGIGVGAGQSRLNFESAIFEDQLQSDYSVSEYSEENVANQAKGYLELNSGLMVFSERFWFGISGHHLNKPKIYSIQNNARLDMKLGVQAGYIYNLSNRNRINKNVQIKNKVLYSLNSVWQGRVWRNALGAKLFYNNVIGNVSLSHINLSNIALRTLLIGVGLNYDMVTFIYGYEIYFGNELKSGGAHEIQINISLQNSNKSNFHSLRNKKSLKSFCPMK